MDINRKNFDLTLVSSRNPRGSFNVGISTDYFKQPSFSRWDKSFVLSVGLGFWEAELILDWGGKQEKLARWRGYSDQILDGRAV